MSSHRSCEVESDGNRDEDRENTDDHLEGVEDGCGCAEIWEHLAEHRASER